MRRNRSATEISLFPFLSILSCIIGTLTLMIAGLTAGEMSAVAAPRVQESLESITARADDATREISQLDQLVLQAQAVADDLIKARAEHARLVKEQARQIVAEALSASQVIQAESRIHELRNGITELETTLEELKVRNAQLERELRGREADALAARNTTQILPRLLAANGNTAQRVPTFVECTRTGLTLRAERTEDQRIHVRTKSIEKSTELKDMLKMVRQDSEATVIYMIRPGGVEAFELANTVSDETDTRHEKMPVPGHRPLDLSYFSPDE
jgi:chromosome segregation ATPase